MLNTLENYLFEYYGYNTFRECQKEIIEEIINNKSDICFIAATGHGKSICYQLPALITGKPSIVITPLLSLMNDQMTKLQSYNINTCCYNSSIVNKSIVNFKIINGDYSIIYITPETLITSYNILKQLNETLGISLFAIDEAHCVSLWGQSFRDSYLQLSNIKKYFPNVPILTLTSTATRKVEKDIIKQLGLENPIKIRTSMNRPNLSYYVHYKTNILNDLKEHLNEKSKSESMIIYCQKRKDAENMCGILQKNGLNCEYYHAGLDSDMRNEIYSDFINNTIDCIIATIAFGMGIDKPDIRKVIHYGCPQNIESYIQETGRAGRDGNLSECHIYFSENDFSNNQYFISKIKNKKLNKQKWEMKRKMEKYLYLKTCRRNYIFNYFKVEETHNDKLPCCDNCTNKLIGVDLLYSEQEATVEAKYFLKLIKKFPLKYGKSMFINAIRGSKMKNLPEVLRNHKYYGIGKDKNRDWWRLCVQYLFMNKLIKFNSSSYVYPTSKALEALDNNFSFTFTQCFTKSNIVNNSQKSKNTNTVNNSQKNKNTNLTNTQETTYFLFYELNKNIKEIANERNLTVNTIYNHLIAALKLGLPMDLEKINYNKDRYLEIITEINNIKDENTGLKFIKEYLFNKGIDCTYEEIKISIAIKGNELVYWQ